VKAVGVEVWWPALLAIVVWPAVVVVVVVVVLLLARGDQQPAVLSAVADLVRAVRGLPGGQTVEPKRAGRDQHVVPPVPEQVFEVLPAVASKS